MKDCNPDDIRAWVALCRELGLTHLTLPSGLSVVLGKEPQPQPGRVPVTAPEKVSATHLAEATDNQFLPRRPPREPGGNHRPSPFDGPDVWSDA